jgi:ribonuclease HI
MATIPCMSVLQLAEDYYQARMANRITSKRQHVIDFIRWRPPQVNWVKLNTDGACKGGNIAGCGGIIRGSDGEWIGGFAKFIGDCSAFVAELWGVLEGLRYVRRMGYTAVELNVDCVSVEKTIKEGVTDSRLGRALVNKIRRLLEMDWNVVVSHSYREANRCADALANIACSLDYNLKIYESCPTQIRHLLLADIMGIATSRLISM